ncbi:SRPBCC family protein [Achromobacter sp. ES-001]|uniref:SRPBCC family protein n=1 Tax=Achromobacter sp. ES-001 TaxID=2860286 RepID=UPI000EC77823|nr:SRPBCC family protein [Achromobacter sp. ES-001]QYJ19524.1 SRPBCC family protein [Achromobacter sp. ES-001]HCQ46122.1 SRPBCC family protein [Achromobacter sp.]
MSHTVFVSAVIHAPLEQVWPCFRDFDGLAAWHPGVAQSRLEADGRHDAVGSVRYLALEPSGFVREQLLMLDDPNAALRYSIIETDLPMRDYTAGVSLHRITQSEQTSGQPSGEHTLVQWWADFRVEGAELADVAHAVGQNVFAAGLAALDEKLRAGQA